MASPDTERSTPQPRELTLVEAANEAFVEEMRRDSRVILLGADVRVGIYGITAGIVDEFGPRRIFDTPLSEAGVSGLAVGAAIGGLRPIVDLMISSFVYLTLDQIINNAAKAHYMFGGQVCVPMVVWALTGARGSTGAQHADSPYAMFMNVPGLKVVVPSNAADVKGLLKSAIRDDNPVVFFQPIALSRQRGVIPEGEHLVPLGQAAVPRSGTDVSIVAAGAMVPPALRAADDLANEGLSVEVVDLRTIAPLDRDTILRSVRKTGRLVAVDESHRTGGVASEVLALVGDAETAARHPVPKMSRLGTADTPIPFSPALEAHVLPNAATIADAVRALTR
jgi:pyruvate dehydrogenase E1 component beta subunit